MAALDFPSTPTVGQTYPNPPVAGVPVYTWNGTTWVCLPSGFSAYPVLRGFIAGLILSTAGAVTTFSVAPGMAADSTNAMMMSLPSSLAKTTAAWAAGAAGALDTGTIAASTWYHVHLIENTTSGVVDILISLSPTAPTLPSGYTLFRRIGAMKTNASSQWTAFLQDGDNFEWITPVAEGTFATPGAAAVTRTLSGCPAGIRVRAYLSVSAQTSSGAADILYLSDLACADVNPSQINGATLFVYNTAPAATGGSGTTYVYTNTAQQIRSRFQTGNPSSFYLITIGWTDSRGKDA